MTSRAAFGFLSQRWGLLTVALAVLLLGAFGFQHHAASSEPTPDDPSDAAVPTVAVATAGEQSWPRVIRVQGSLLGDEQAVVGCEVAGLVRQVKIDLGSVVRKDDVLAVLDLKEFDLKVRQAEAALMQARAKLGLRPGDAEEKLDRTKTPAVRQERTTLDMARIKAKRTRDLLHQRATSLEVVEWEETQAEVAEARHQAALNGADELIAQIKVLRAELEFAEQLRKEATIRAPFDGVVSHRHVAPGVFLQRGESVVTLVRTNPLRFRAQVPEREALHIKVGQTVRVEIEGLPVPLTATVSRLSPSVDLASRARVIEADIPNDNSQFPAGLFAEGRIVIDAGARTMAVPASAVAEFAGVEKVWVVRDGEAVELPVRTGRRSHEAVEILDGLQSGDQVVLDARQARPGRVAAAPSKVIIRGTAD